MNVASAIFRHLSRLFGWRVCFSQIHVSSWLSSNSITAIFIGIRCLKHGVGYPHLSCSCIILNQKNEFRCTIFCYTIFSAKSTFHFVYMFRCLFVLEHDLETSKRTVFNWMVNIWFLIHNQKQQKWHFLALSLPFSAFVYQHLWLEKNYFAIHRFFVKLLFVDGCSFFWSCL